MATIQTEFFKAQVVEIINRLPEDKILELLDFASYLMTKYTDETTSVDTSALLIQQKAMSKIWDNPEEDIYEL